ncbi:unnamed protein product, partial [Chrysoparadoxa australica]
MRAAEKQLGFVAILLACVSWSTCSPVSGGPLTLTTKASLLPSEAHRCYGRGRGLRVRGGSTAPPDSRADDEAENEEDGEEEKEEEAEPAVDDAAVAWLLEQTSLYQTRIALLSQELSKKGFAVRSVLPDPPGLRCALSTEEHPMPCRVYMEPEPGSKVVAPCKCKGSQKWIAIKALNQQRRKEPEAWRRCPTCSAPIDYSLYEKHLVGIEKALPWILGHRRVGAGVLLGGLALAVVLVGNAFKFFIIRLLVSGLLWEKYHIVSRILYLPLPLKILALQFLRK